MQATMARPDKSTGRIVLGPRQVRNGYARIVAISDGSGRIELFDPQAGAWREASDACTFAELWRAAPVFDTRYLRVLSRTADC